MAINAGPSLANKISRQKQPSMRPPQPMGLGVGPSPSANIPSMGPPPSIGAPPPTMGVPRMSTPEPMPPPMIPPPTPMAPPIMGPSTPSRGIPFEQGGFIGPGMGPQLGGINTAPTNYLDPANAVIPGMGSQMGGLGGGLRQAYGGNFPSSQFGNRRF